MIFIIDIRASRELKIRAAFMFLLCTVVGSILVLLAILLIYFQVGTTNHQILDTIEFSEKVSLYLG